MPTLTKNNHQRPIHLLGVGEIDDIFAAVERGVDMMDCVMPTRLGRMGHVLVKRNVRCETRDEKSTLDVTKAEFTQDPRPIEEDCQCFVCQNFSRAYLNHLFRAKELLAYRLATYHNLFFMEQLFVKIREAIKKGEFSKLRHFYLRKL
jgi:tRNA-guanine family transglycosylase